MFEDLKDRELSAIMFVRDYIQLGFDGLGITLLVDPVLRSGASELRKNQKGFCDAVVALIGGKLVAIQHEEGRFFTITFDTGASLWLPLSVEARPASGEALIFYGADSKVTHVL